MPFCERKGCCWCNRARRYDPSFDSSSYLGVKRQIAEYRAYARAMTVLIRNDQRSLLRFYLFLGCHVLRLAARKM